MSFQAYLENIRAKTDKTPEQLKAFVDFVAIDEPASRIRFGSCKHSDGALVRDVATFEGHVQRFLESFPKHQSWHIERVALAPSVSDDIRKVPEARGLIAQDLATLTRGL